jgi:hypothetical protein
MVTVCVGITVLAAVDVIVGTAVSVGCGVVVLVGVIVLEGGMMTIVDVDRVWGFVLPAAEQPTRNKVPMPITKQTDRAETTFFIIQPA